jgi:hypothetical protein
VSAGDPASRSVTDGIASAAAVHRLEATVEARARTPGSGILIGSNGFGSLVRSTIAPDAGQVAIHAVDYE